MNKYVCCSVTDQNYILPTCVTISSLCVNNKGIEIQYFVVLDGVDQSDEKLNCIKKLTKLYQNLSIEFIAVHANNELVPRHIVKEMDRTLVGNRLTRSSYLRLFLSELLPTYIDRVLYLDSDVLCLDDIREFYFSDFRNAPLIGVKDISSEIHKDRLNIPKYINGGVLLVNLAFWREMNVIQKFCLCIEKNSSRLLLHDQDVINLTFEDSLIITSQEWNYQFFACPQLQDLSGIKLLHFITEQKPWRSGNISPYRKLWSNYSIVCLGTAIWENPFSLKEKLIFKLRWCSYYLLPHKSKRREMVKKLLSYLKSV